MASANFSCWPISANRRSPSSSGARLVQGQIQTLIGELEGWMHAERFRLSRHADIAKFPPPLERRMDGGCHAQRHISLRARFYSLLSLWNYK